MTTSELNDEVWDRLVAFICEQTGVTQYLVENILRAERAYWQAHPGLADCLAVELDDDF